MPYDIAILPGDGIGPEVIDAALPVLNTTADQFGFSIRTERFDWGTDHYRTHGEMMPEDAPSQLKSFDSILLGAVGHPDVQDHITLHGMLLPIRKEFDQYICKRPSILFEGIESPIKGYAGNEIDLVVFRENTEGEYADIGGREHEGFEHEIAVQTSVFTRMGVERIVRAAFEEATTRSKHVTSITKSNAQAHSMVFWDEIVDSISDDFPDVDVERLLVDAASMDMIRRPDEFDVIVASNLFGDIITDIAAIVTGSMGLAPSANITPREGYPSMFEPVHGSAPDIVGDEIANPLATMLSVSMLLEELGERKAGTHLWQSVTDQLADPSAPKTPDIGGEATTTDVADDIQTRLTN